MLTIADQRQNQNNKERREACQQTEIGGDQGNRFDKVSGPDGWGKLCKREIGVIDQMEQKPLTRPPPPE